MFTLETVLASYTLARLIIDLRPPVYELPTRHIVMSENFFKHLLDLANQASKIKEEAISEAD